MSTTAPVSQRPPIHNQTTEIPTASFFTKEKITRLALQIISALALLGAIVVGANVIVGTTTAWHAFTSLCLCLTFNYLWSQASKIADLNDPHELEWARNDIVRKSFIEMIQTYSLDTIMQYGLVSFSLLRGRCYVGLLHSRDGGVNPIFIQNADKLLQHRVITSEMHRMIVENDIAAIGRLPGNGADMDEIFRAYDNA